MTTQSLHIFIKGRVQGVGFRYFVLTRARELNLNGFARNLADGSVEVYAEGDPDTLGQFREMLERGPELASVQETDVQIGEAKEQIRGFYIR